LHLQSARHAASRWGHPCRARLFSLVAGTGVGGRGHEVDLAAVGLGARSERELLAGGGGALAEEGYPLAILEELAGEHVGLHFTGGGTLANPAARGAAASGGLRAHRAGARVLRAVDAPADAAGLGFATRGLGACGLGLVCAGFG